MLLLPLPLFNRHDYFFLLLHAILRPSSICLFHQVMRRICKIPSSKHWRDELWVWGRKIDRLLLIHMVRPDVLALPFAWCLLLHFSCFCLAFLSFPLALSGHIAYILFHPRSLCFASCIIFRCRHSIVQLTLSARVTQGSQCWHEFQWGEKPCFRLSYSRHGKRCQFIIQFERKNFS